jgi:hypothetical protein
MNATNAPTRTTAVRDGRFMTITIAARSERDG